MIFGKIKLKSMNKLKTKINDSKVGAPRKVNLELQIENGHMLPSPKKWAAC